jgi:hypothetical protein
MTLREATEMLYQAAAESFGLLLDASDPGRVRQQLYQAKRKAEDSSLDELQIRFSPLPDGNLVICHPEGATLPDTLEDLGL